ncbi:MAG TPA: BlaI/MecI/CopY family transcriptional regulator [Thermoanaerobaculia bacterium]|nr:BlaI/MecI/CopY family transcriptional regulator [Thermoanaerobaculia bacterium]
MPSPRRKPARNAGQLQAEIMELLWKRGEASVRDIHDALRHTRPIAYTTVMTVMSRLAARKLLRRRRAGTLYLYRPAETREESASKAIDSILARLGRAIGTPVLSRFVDTVHSRSPETLEELAKLVEEKRRKTKK